MKNDFECNGFLFVFIFFAFSFIQISLFEHCITLRSKKDESKSTIQKSELASKNNERSDNPSSQRGTSCNNSNKKLKLSTQRSMIMMQHNKVITGRRNTCVVTLAQFIDSAIINFKNSFDMAMAC